MNHFTGLAHIALFTRDLEATIRFYEILGGVKEDFAEIQKPHGVNRLAMVRLPGFYLEVIEPHAGTEITPADGFFPHIAIETDDIDQAVAMLKAAGVTSFRSEAPVTLDIFGGIRNIFFTGPSGELLELLEHA